MCPLSGIRYACGYGFRATAARRPDVLGKCSPTTPPGWRGRAGQPPALGLFAKRQPRGVQIQRTLRGSSRVANTKRSGQRLATTTCGSQARLRNLTSMSGSACAASSYSAERL